jgi:glycosyltransferase involved in cell wall biosynthesis
METEKAYVYEEASLLKDIVVLIPAFNPNNKLVMLVNELIKRGIENIIVVDDGSKNQCKDIFQSIKVFNQCTVLKHANNLGKGRALKTGFNYFLNHYIGFIGIITVDADGQHKCEDIIKVAQALAEHQDSLILGTRNFNDKKVPFRSRFGNKITARIFSFFSGINISDTQTGLRGIPCKHVSSMLKTRGERFEYEMNMLMECSQKKVGIRDIAIDTIYIEDNKSSHFNPFLDSVKIYLVFLKFIVSSLASFVVDILSFIILTSIFRVLMPSYFILLSTIGSRIISSAFNYAINRNAVFYYKGMGKTVNKYYMLSVVQMLISALGVSLIYSQVHQGDVIIKMIVDSALFLASFTIQRDWVFVSETQL